MADNLALAQKHAWNLARTLMTPVVLFQSGDQYGVLPADEIEDGEVFALYKYDPFKGARPVH